ncbi:hypothetical protein BJX61DRAFT_499536 [Aspergillus egyptiacus]|nr:hypothetical protein BJX61DRAFT_499536 [Aspergillus egyptiacus]
MPVKGINTSLRTSTFDTLNDIENYPASRITILILSLLFSISDPSVRHFLSTNRLGRKMDWSTEDILALIMLLLSIPTSFVAIWAICRCCSANGLSCFTRAGTSSLLL